MKNISFNDSGEFSGSEDDSIDDGNNDDVSDDEEESVERLPRVLLSFALNSLEENRRSFSIPFDHERCLNALQKSRSVILEIDNDLKKIFEKFQSRRSDDKKVAPGSKLVMRSLDDNRYILSLCCCLLSELHERQNELQHAKSRLREALMWFPKNSTALLNLGRLLKVESTTHDDIETVVSLISRFFKYMPIRLSERNDSIYLGSTVSQSCRVSRTAEY